MDLETSVDGNEPSCTLPSADGSGIQLTHIPGNIYESLENRDRDSHAYNTSGEAVPTARFRANNVNSKPQPGDANKHGVALSSLKVELPIWQLAVLILLVCSVICTIAGVIVYHVIYVKIAEIEKHTSQNHDAEAHAQKNTSGMASFDCHVDIELWMHTFDSMVEAVHTTLQAMQENQNISELATLNYRTKTDKRFEAFNDMIRTVDAKVEATQKQQNMSDRASLDYREDIVRRLETLNDTVQIVYDTIDVVQEKQNTSGRQVAFTVHGATGMMVNSVLTFTNVILNIGDSYDSTTGRFRCPVAGTYLFSTTLFSIGTRTDQTYCVIRKNAAIVATVNSYEGRNDSASITVVLHLFVGDYVDVGYCYNVNYIRTKDGHTMFTGSLVQAD